MGRGPLALHLSRAAAEERLAESEERLAESEERLQEARKEINERDRRLAHATVSLTQAAEDIARVTEQVATMQQQLSDARAAEQAAFSARTVAEQATAELQLQLSGAQTRERELRVAVEAERIARQRAESSGARLRSTLHTLRPLVGVLGQATADLRGALELSPVGESEADPPAQSLDDTDLQSPRPASTPDPHVWPHVAASDPQTTGGSDRRTASPGRSQQRPWSTAGRGSEPVEVGLVRVLAEVVDRWRTHNSEQ
jgi:hypothetical protein